MTTTTAATSASTTQATTPVSISSSSSAGAAGGSVINVSSLVSQLVAASQAPQQAVITAQTTAVTTDLSALGTLQSALSSFQSSLTPLSTPNAFNAENATSTNPLIFTASAAADAVSGSYAVTVSALASGQQLLSAPFSAGSSAVVGTGTLQLTVGGSSFSVPIGSSDDTLAGIASAINTASANTAVSATVIQGTDGAHLLLSSTQTGAANTITVSETDAGTGLAALTHSANDTTNYTQVAPAQDAAFSVAGVPYTSATNTVSDAISGVSLTLLATNATTTGTGASAVTTTNTPASLTVANDTSTTSTNIQAFVTAYNTLHTALTGLGSYDASTGTAGPMLGNAVLTGTESQLQQALYSLVGSSNYNSLASIGITTNSDGSLSLNSQTLQAALTNNFSAVSNLFSGTSGIATQLNSQIKNDLGSTGSITSYGQSLTAQNNALTKQTSTLDTQMAALSASLTQQYSALNSLLSSLQSTSSYLTQAFATLPTVQGTSNA